MDENQKSKSEQFKDVVKQAGYDPNRTVKPTFGGMAGSIGAVYTPTSGTALGTSGQAPGYVAPTSDDPNRYRIGDYIPDTKTGGYKLIENSPTDLIKKYVTSDAMAKGSLGLGDYFDIAGDAIYTGVTTGITTGVPGVGVLAAGAKVLDSVVNAQKKLTDEYLNQDFNYELAGGFETDESGKTVFKPDYVKMAEGGSESGSAVLEAQKTDDTNVKMLADNQMEIQVSPAFAASENYQSLLSTIKENYGTLTVEDAKKVVDQDTGATLLDTINSLVKATESNYLYNSQEVKRIKEQAPAASDNALNAAVELSKIGYYSDDMLGEIEIQIYDQDNNLQKVNAKEYLDSIKNMDKLERNNYMLSIGNKIESPDISDDERAVLYAQSQALYAASSNDGEYKGMYDKDFWDTVGDISFIVPRVAFWSEELSTFRRNEFFGPLLQTGSNLASLFALSKMSNLIEGGIRKLTPTASEWAGQNLRDAMRSVSSVNTARDLATIIGKSTTALGYNLGADALYDLGKMAAFNMAGYGDEFNYFDELSNDFMMDMLITYGPGQFARGMDADKYEYRFELQNPKTGEITYKHKSDMTKSDWGKVVMDNNGMREIALVKVTAEELSMRRARQLDKWTDSKVGIKVQELFFDKNAAMSKLAIQTKKVTGDSYYFRKMLRFSGDIKQVTSDIKNEFLMKDTVKEHQSELKNKIKLYAPGKRDLTKADQAYINAKANEHRFTKMAKEDGDLKSVEFIENFYKDAINGVSPERAAQLDDLAASMRKFADDVLDFYHDRDIMSAEDVDKLRNRPEYAGGMFLPVWTKNRVPVGGDISQQRSATKKIFDRNQLVSVDDLDNPLNSLAGYISNGMRNVAINERALAIREAASIAGIDMHAIEDTDGSLKDVENLTQLNEAFQKKYDNIVKSVKKAVPDAEAWQKINDTLVLDSKALKTADELGKLREDAKRLNRELRNAKSRAKRVSTDRPTYYHGTPSGGFTEFKDGSYFTQNKAYADRYQIPSASSLTAGKEVGTPMTYEVKLNVNNTFDITKDEKARDIFFNEYVKGGNAIGIDPNTTKSELSKIDDVDWTEGENLREFLLEKGYDYDSLVVKEGGDFDEFGNVISRGRGMIVFDGKKVEILDDAINKLQKQIETNKQAQLEKTDQIKDQIREVMEEAAKKNKYSGGRLDIQSFLDIQVTKGIKDALKSGNDVGKLQDVINQAVSYANPYVDADHIIRERAEKAAAKFRKDLNKQMVINKRIEKPTSDKINDIADKAMDFISEKVTGERNNVTAIDDAEATRILNNHDGSHTIRYLINGEEHKFVLTGKGSEELVAEFYAPEAWTPKTTSGKIAQRFLNVGNRVAQAKRYLTTSADPTRVLPNLARDWSRGIVSTGGEILLSPDQMKNELVQKYGYDNETVNKINRGWELARQSIDKETFTSSMEMPRKNRSKSMIRAMNEPDGNGFIKFIYDRAESVGKLLSTPQDMAETFTRKRAMDTAYYKELSDAQARGYSMDESIKRAVESAYFAGRESTVNFMRRGRLVSAIAQQVPYLSQNFASLESFKYSYIDDPIKTMRTLKTTVSSYAMLISIALSTDESRKKYFLLTEYDRANNIIIPIDNGMIMTIPLDENIAAFLTPYRRMIETMNGLDPQAFYLCFLEGLADLSPLDLSGFSEGDKFNLQRGFEKLGSQLLPTWLQPFIEAQTGRDLFYGSDISVDAEYTGATQGIFDPTPGQLTTKSKNSKLLASVADKIGIPQWILQNFMSEYGGNVGSYVLNTLDKLSGATEYEQGGKEFQDAIFKSFTGQDSDSASNAFYNAVNILKEEKKTLQGQIATINKKIEASTGDEKARLQEERQKKITDYGIRVTDLLTQYLNAYELTGGLSKQQATQAIFLYQLYNDNFNQNLYLQDTTGDYYTDKAKAYNNKQMANLAAISGLDAIVRSPVSDYNDTYAEQAFMNTVYGDPIPYIASIENILKDNEINRGKMYEGYYAATTKDAKKKWKDAWNTKVVTALAPYVDNVGIDTLLGQRKIVDYLDEVIFISNPFQTKDYLKKIFGGS